MRTVTDQRGRAALLLVATCLGWGAGSASPGVVCARFWYGRACELGERWGCQQARRWSEPQYGK